MKENWSKFTETIKTTWNKTTKKQKITYGSITAVLLTAIIVLTILMSKTSFVPLYSKLSLEEVGQIKEELEVRNIAYKIEDEGTTILVPKEHTETLLVDLAKEGIPKSGNIDYSFFSENASWGITDNEFNIMKLDAMQTELANLIKGIEGIEDANVMINLPQQSVFVSDTVENASVSIVLQTKYGYEFQPNQIQGLYHLVERAIPNLPEENIAIMNQNFEYFDAVNSNGVENDFAVTQDIKKTVERDLQKRVQQMLSAVIGMDKVITSVTADIDFTAENRVEELAEPVDVDSMEGIPVSIETIQETFEGTNAEGGVAGTGEEDIANYPGAIQGENGDYELAKETINYEFNKIQRDIAEAPYKIRDIGIQVMVDNQRMVEGEIVELSPEELNTVEEGIDSILSSMITTTIDKGYGEIDPEEKISIVFQQFHGIDTPEDERTTFMQSGWLYIIIAAIVIALIAFILYRRRKQKEQLEEELEIADMTPQEMDEHLDVPDLESQPKTEADIQREQLEKMAKEKPEDFARLLRSWISED